MLETSAKVVQVAGEITLVEANGASGCAQCKGQGCGSGKLTQLFCNGPRQFRVENRINAKIGDVVIISVAEGSVLLGVSLIYLLPLLLLFAGALLAQQFALLDDQRDGYGAVGALLGLVTGFVLAKWISLQRSRRRPCIDRLAGE